MTIFLLDNNPYMQKFHAYMFQTSTGYEVRWVEYNSVKQDRCFNSCGKADRFLRNLYKNKNKIEREDCLGISLEECHEFWASL